MELQDYLLEESRVEVQRIPRKGGSTIMAASLLTRRVEVIAMRKMTFMERWEKEHVAKDLNRGL